jgi:hypothetical protein
MIDFETDHKCALPVNPKKGEYGNENLPNIYVKLNKSVRWKKGTEHKNRLSLNKFHSA